MKLRESEDASSILELALILPPALLIACAIFNYAFWIQKAIRLQEAAAAGAAYGAIPGNASNSTGMIQAANYSATGSPTGGSGVTVTATNFYACTPGGTQVTVDTSCPSGAAFHYVQVTASTTASATVRNALLPSSLALTGIATLRVESYP
jgi:Flp pilus assembly protein TadG